MSHWRHTEFRLVACNAGGPLSPIVAFRLSICAIGSETTCRANGGAGFFGLVCCGFRTSMVRRKRQHARVVHNGGPFVGTVHTDEAAVTSEPIGGTSTQQWTQRSQWNTALAWRSSPYGDRRCSSHLSHQNRQNVRCSCKMYNSDSQFPGPNPGGKRLSRRVARHTLLALKWPEMIQIARCKVRWLPCGA